MRRRRTAADAGGREEGATRSAAKEERNEGMSGVDGRTDGRTDGWMDGWMDVGNG